MPLRGEFLHTPCPEGIILASELISSEYQSAWSSVKCNSFSHLELYTMFHLQKSLFQVVTPYTCTNTLCACIDYFTMKLLHALSSLNIYTTNIDTSINAILAYNKRPLAIICTSMDTLALYSSLQGGSLATAGQHEPIRYMYMLGQSLCIVSQHWAWP